MCLIDGRDEFVRDGGLPWAAKHQRHVQRIHGGLNDSVAALPIAWAGTRCTVGARRGCQHRRSPRTSSHSVQLAPHCRHAAPVAHMQHVPRQLLGGLGERGTCTVVAIVPAAVGLANEAETGRSSDHTGIWRHSGTVRG